MQIHIITILSFNCSIVCSCNKKWKKNIIVDKYMNKSINQAINHLNQSINQIKTKQNKSNQIKSINQSTNKQIGHVWDLDLGCYLCEVDPLTGCVPKWSIPGKLLHINGEMAPLNPLVGHHPCQNIWVGITVHHIFRQTHFHTNYGHV